MDTTMRTAKAIWRGNTMIPKAGTEGTAWPAHGFDDPESIEYGAYCFEPDTPCEGDEPGSAYYCDPDRDLEFIPQAMREPRLRRSATRKDYTVRWSNWLVSPSGTYAGQSGAWTFLSTEEAEAFLVYASQDPPPSLAAEDLKAAGVPLPVSCDGWSILN